MFAHLPILRNPDKSKLSKRKNPVWVSWFREKGFLPEAILNYLALMGWSMPDEKEVFSLEEFIKKLTLERIQTSGPVFDITKLEWMNGEYLRQLSIESYESRITEYLKQYHTEVYSKFIETSTDIFKKTIPLVQTRIKTFSEHWPMVEFFFTKPESYEKEINKEWILKSAELLQSLEKWTHDLLYTEMTKLADELKVSKSKLFMDIRIALTGKKVGPPLFESMEILGKTDCIDRLKF
jgi:glutamyl-tRNA synthetase